jgi:hypothetical protein
MVVEQLIDEALADRVGDFSYPNGSVSDQLIDAIAADSVPPSPADLRKTFEDGGFLYSGCRIRSCVHEHGAIVVGANGRLQAAAMLHHHCHVPPERRWPGMTERSMLAVQRCDDEKHFTLFLSRMLTNDLYRQAMYEWARSRGYLGAVEIEYFP